MHRIRRITFAEHDVALAEFAARHERFQPIYRCFSRRRSGLHVFYQLSHLVQAHGVERQKYQVQNKRGIYPSKKSVDNEEAVTGHAHDAERNHRLHRAGNDICWTGRVAEPHRPFGMTQELHSHPPQWKSAVDCERRIEFLSILYSVASPWERLPRLQATRAV